MEVWLQEQIRKRVDETTKTLTAENAALKDQLEQLTRDYNAEVRMRHEVEIERQDRDFQIIDLKKEITDWEQYCMCSDSD